MKNYYKILEVRESASDEIIRAAYKTLAKKYHPDNSSDETSQKKMIEINEAYQVLSDKLKRQEYDMSLEKNSNMCNEGHKDFQRKREDVDDEENKTEEEEKQKDNRIIKIFKDVGKSMLNAIHEAELEYQEAYFQGIKMDDFELVYSFRKAKGYKRNGYIKALEERGFLEKDINGRYKPTYAMKRYL